MQGNGHERDKLHFKDTDLYILDIYGKARTSLSCHQRRSCSPDCHALQAAQLQHNQHLTLTSRLHPERFCAVKHPVHHNTVVPASGTHVSS